MGADRQCRCKVPFGSCGTGHEEWFGIGMGPSWVQILFLPTVTASEGTVAGCEFLDVLPSLWGSAFHFT